MTAKLTLNRSRTDSTTRACYKLHWLPIRVTIEYKILLLVVKCLNNMTPRYLENLLSINNREGIARNLHSSEAVVLIVPYVKNKTLVHTHLVCRDPLGGIDYWLHCGI